MTKENMTLTGAGNRPVEKEMSVESTKSRLDIYKIFWIFIYGSVCGFVVETVWCLLVHQRYMWRSAVIFLPVNAVYGIGAIALHLLLRNINKEKKLYIFAVGTIGGTVVEYIISFVQETVFGTISWDYSHMPLNIDGRVCLLFSVFWGFLALGWVFYFYPWLERGLSAIPAENYKTITKLVLVIVLVLALISVAAIFRWTMRREGIDAMNKAEIWFDTRFSDRIMEFFYPSMKFSW